MLREPLYSEQPEERDLREVWCGVTTRGRGRGSVGSTGNCGTGGGGGGEWFESLLRNKREPGYDQCEDLYGVNFHLAHPCSSMPQSWDEASLSARLRPA